MACNHERIKSVNCELFCMDCGEKLPADFFTAKQKAAEPQEEKKPTRKKVK